MKQECNAISFTRFASSTFLHHLYAMEEIFSSAAENIIEPTAQAISGFLQPKINVEIKNYRENLKLKFCNHFHEDATCQIPPNREGKDEILASYTNNAGKKSNGAIICELESTSGELSRNTFLMVGWEIPIVGEPRTYAIVLDTDQQINRWAPQHIKDKYERFKENLEPYKDTLKKNWSLNNQKKIQLILDFAGSGVYHLKITVWEDKPTNDEPVNSSMELGPLVEVEINDTSGDEDRAAETPSRWTRCKKVNIIIQNNCEDIKLGGGTCTVLKGDKKQISYNQTIPCKGIEKIVIKAEGLVIRSPIECCIVYELNDPQQQRESLCQDYRIFIAIYLLIDSSSNQGTKVFLFKTKRRFAGGNNDIAELYTKIIKKREHSADDTLWNINEQTFSLKSSFIYGKFAFLNVTLEKTEPNTESGFTPCDLDNESSANTTE
jgi:hypothetical protein